MRFLLLSDVTHFASKARKAYERFQNDPSSAVAQYAENENFILHFRKSAGRYIIAAEPFKTADEAKAFQKKILSFQGSISIYLPLQTNQNIMSKPIE